MLRPLHGPDRGSAGTLISRGALLIGPALIAPVLIVAILSGIAAASSLTDLELGMTGNAAYYAPLFVAQEKGFFAEEGLQVNIVRLNTSDLVRALASGSLGLGLPEAGPVITAIDRGADLALGAGLLDRFPYDFLARPDITSFEDLKGARIGMWQISPSVPLEILRELLRRNGLQDNEYGIVVAGNNFERYAALTQGAIAATVMADPVNFQAKAEGFRELGSFYDIPVAFNYIGFHRSWASQHERELVSFLKALIVAHRYIRDPANRDDVVDIVSRVTQVEPRYVGEAYNLLYIDRPEITSYDLAINEESIQTNIDILARIGLVTNPQDVAYYVDDTYWLKAMRELEQ